MEGIMWVAVPGRQNARDLCMANHADVKTARLRETLRDRIEKCVSFVQNNLKTSSKNLFKDLEKNLCSKFAFFSACPLSSLCFR